MSADTGQDWSQLTYVPLTGIESSLGFCLYDENGLSTRPAVNDVCLNDVLVDPDADPSDPPPDVFQIRVGDTFFERLWINANGFVSLGMADETEGAPFAESNSMAEVEGNVIAPFRSNIEPGQGTDCNETDFDEADDCIVSYSTMHQVRYDLEPEDSRQDIEKGAGPLAVLRISWDSFVRAGATDDPPIRNNSQVRIIDQSRLDGGEPGDFDIEFDYGEFEVGVIEWEEGSREENPHTLIGFKIGDYVLDFNDYYEFFAARGGTCTPLPDNTRSAFNPAEPFECNRITVQFRGGEPELASYTSRLQLTAPMAPASPYAGETQNLQWTVNNAGPENATNLKIEVTVPSTVTLVPTGLSPEGTTCSQPLGATLITCTFPDFPFGFAAFTVPVTSTVAGAPLNLSARVSSDQWDPDAGLNPSNNVASFALTLLASSDINVEQCVAPTTLQTGASGTVTCTVRNLGPQPAAGVQVAITLPSVLSFASGTNCTAGPPVTCTIGDLAANTPATVSITVNAGNTAGSGTVRGDSSLTPTAQDRNGNNNSSTSGTVTVQAAPPPPPPPTSGGGGGGGTFGLFWLVLLALIQRLRISASPNAEVLTSFAPSISRAKS